MRERKSLPFGLLFQGFGDVAEMHFFNPPAFIANHELGAFMLVVFGAGDVSVQAFDAVNKAVLNQKL